MSSLKDIGDKLSEFVDKVKGALEDEPTRQLIAGDLGLPPTGSVPKPTLPQDKLDSIALYRSKADPDKEAFIQLLNDVKAVYEAVRGFIASLGVSNVTTQNQILYKLFDLFALNEVRVRAPAVYFLVQALAAMVEDSAEFPGLTTDDLADVRFLKSIGLAAEFAVSPLYYIFTIMSAKDPARAKYISDRLFPHIAGAAAFLQEKPLDESRLIYGWDGRVTPKRDKPLEFDRASATPIADELAERMFTIGFPFKQGSSTSESSGHESLDLTFALIPESHGEPLEDDPSKKTGGLLISVGGEGAMELQINDRWKFALEASAKPAFSLFLRSVFPPRIKNAEAPTTGVPLNVALLTIPDAQNITYQFPHEAETHVEIGQLAFSFSYDGFNGGIQGELRRGAIVIATKDQDGFLSKFLPKDGLRVPFNFNTGFNTDGGFFTGGNIPFLSDISPKKSSTAAALPSSSTPSTTSTPTSPSSLAAAPAPSPVSIPAGVTSPGTVTPSTTTAPATLSARTLTTATSTRLASAALSPLSDATAAPTTTPTLTRDATPIETPPVTPSETPTVAADSTASDNGGSAAPIPKLSSTAKPSFGLQQVIPIGKEALGVRFNSLFLGASPGTNNSVPQIKGEVSVSLTLTIGPVTAVVDRVGFNLALSFPDTGGNLGFADFDAGFKAPSGVGITVDAPAVTGGGFLFLDQDKGQYAGFLQLALEGGISVKAVGIIMTRLPDGTKGFSFLIMITVENFQPIPLGLGFTLTGIGGLVAINRTVNQDVLREGIKNKTLNDILFPKDPIRNAPQIFGTLNRVFPPREGSYLFGPVVQICWGTPALVTMDLGVILEVGNRTRLIILGRVAAILPTEKNDLIRIQMNTVGIIDFDQKSISLDAVLYDSRLVGKFPITGGMALRVSWGANKEFALSIGGFHPAFKPPPAFPTLDRLAISFADSDSFRLRADGYFAITANTVQWGAHAELFAKAGGFSISGAIGYDVLIQFDPFGFIADFHASVQLKHGSTNLFKVSVDGELRGPRPLTIKGKATFSIFWCDFSVHVDHTFISGDAPPRLPPVRVMDKLRAALDDPRNWTGQIGDAERAAVTVRQSQSPTQLALHPLGKLSVKQTVVPLELRISKFGSAAPTDANTFSITNVTLNGAGTNTTKETDFFAPGQFLDLSDDDKLAAPSFEQMVAGVTINAAPFVFSAASGDILEDPALMFETVVIDDTTLPPPPPLPPTPLSSATIGQQIAIGAAARSDLRKTGAARYAPSSAKNSRVAPRWAVVSAADQSPQTVPGMDPTSATSSYSQTYQALEEVKATDPVRAKTLMLVRA